MAYGYGVQYGKFGGSGVKTALVRLIVWINSNSIISGVVET